MLSISMRLAGTALVFAVSSGQAAVDLSLDKLTVTPGTLTPGFSPTRKYYAVAVASTVPSVTVNVTPKSPDVTASVNGKAVAPGQDSEPVSVDVGRNLVALDLATKDGAAKEHVTIEVNRACPTPSWVRVTDKVPWPARDSAGELVFKERMWLLGGYIPAVIGDVWSSADGTEWTQAGTIPNPAGVNIPVTFVYKEQMWTTTNDGCFYSSADGATWNLATDKAPWKGRYAAGGVVFNDRMWVLGGLRGGLFNDVWSSTDGVNWTLEVEHAPWSPRQLFSMVVAFDGKMWVLGGGITNYHPFKAYNDVWCSADGKTWTQATDNAPWQPRIWTAATVYRNRIWVFNGFRAEPVWTNLNDVWYSADGATWKQLVTETVWPPRHEGSAYVFKDKFWYVAGNEWPLRADVWCLDIPGLVFLTQPVIEDYVNARYTYRAMADFNASRGQIQYRLAEAPAWLSVDAKTGCVTGTPPAAGDFPVTIEAKDDAGETARQSYTLHALAFP